MIVLHKKKYVLKGCERLSIFKGVLIKKGNKARVYRYILDLLKYLKNPQNIEGISNTLINKPLEIIDHALHQGAPFFTYKRIVKSGKLYEIPVPISLNRATYMAASWISKVAQKRTVEGAPAHTFIASEIVNILKKKGGTIDLLNTYTAEGLEKNIFKKFVKKKFTIVSRSKHINAFRNLLKKMNKKARRNKYRKKFKGNFYMFMLNRNRHKLRIYRQRKLREKYNKNKNLLKTNQNKTLKSLNKSKPQIKTNYYKSNPYHKIKTASNNFTANNARKKYKNPHNPHNPHKKQFLKPFVQSNEKVTKKPFVLSTEKVIQKPLPKLNEKSYNKPIEKFKKTQHEKKGPNLGKVSAYSIKKFSNNSTHVDISKKDSNIKQSIPKKSSLSKLSMQDLRVKK